MVRVGDTGFLFYQIFPDSGSGIPSNGAGWITVCSTDVPLRGSAVGFCTGGDNKWFTDPAFRFCDASQIV